MAIFLVQHGLCRPREEDPEKSLSDQGRKDTEKIAEVAGIYQIPVSKIKHSGKKRAEETAAVFRLRLDIKAPCEQIGGIFPLDDVAAFGDGLEPGSNEMVVGHLPFMERLVSYLTTGSEDFRLYRFQNSGIVSLDRDKEGNWFIKWTLNPNIS